MNKQIRPWYGTWPPRVYKGGESMKKQRGRDGKGWLAKIPPTFTMVIAFIVGILFIVVSYELKSAGVSIDYDLFHDLGIAFTVAGVLGVGIDLTLRKQLTDDAFKASIGYLLPDELKGEMEWIYSTHILCMEHIQTCELRQIDADACAIHISMLRKFRNVSSSNETLTLGPWVDEWFHKAGSSKILAFGYTKLGKKSDSIEIVKAPYTIRVKEQQILLAPDEEVTIWLEAEEIKHTNDAQNWVFGYPTLNPIVTVRAFEGVSMDVKFGYRSSAEELGNGTYRLKGTLLSGQRIEIRWWEKEKGDKWVNEKQ